MQTNKISAKRAITTSFLVSVADIVLNLALTLITGSTVMLTQALEGGSDLLASGLLLYGNRRSKIGHDKKHPFGHGKELYFWTMMAAFTTFTITAGLSFYFGYQRYLNPEPIHNINLALATLSLTFITNGYSFTLSFKRLIGKRGVREIFQVFYQSNLVETKTTLIIDLMGTAAALLGIISLVIYSTTNDYRYDGLGAMLIGGVLAVLAISIISEVKDLLIGKSAGTKVENKIVKVAKSVPSVNNVLEIRTMIVGSNKILVNLEVNLKDELTTDELEVLIDKIKAKIKSEVPEVGHIQVELESPDLP